VTATWTEDYELRLMTAAYSRTYTGGPPQDNEITTHHFLNLTGGSPDDTWTTSDYTQVETAFGAYWDAIKSYYATSTKLLELRWYAQGPAFKPFGTAPSPILRITPVNVAGTSSSPQLPPQSAMSVTEVTAAHYTVPPHEGKPGQLRHRWGRYYLPAPTTDVLGATAQYTGRINPGAQVAIANATQTFYNACRGGASLVPVLYSTKLGSAYSVDEIHVDDIFDVIRRRRFTTPLSREPRTLNPVTGG